MNIKQLHQAALLTKTITRKIKKNILKYTILLLTLLTSAKFAVIFYRYLRIDTTKFTIKAVHYSSTSTDSVYVEAGIADSSCPLNIRFQDLRVRIGVQHTVLAELKMLGGEIGKGEEIGVQGDMQLTILNNTLFKALKTHKKLEITIEGLFKPRLFNIRKTVAKKFQFSKNLETQTQPLFVVKSFALQHTEDALSVHFLLGDFVLPRYVNINFQSLDFLIKAEDKSYKIEVGDVLIEKGATAGIQCCIRIDSTNAAQVSHFVSKLASTPTLTVLSVCDTRSKHRLKKVLKNFFSNLEVPLSKGHSTQVLACVFEAKVLSVAFNTLLLQLRIHKSMITQALTQAYVSGQLPEAEMAIKAHSQVLGHVALTGCFEENDFLVLKPLISIFNIHSLLKAVRRGEKISIDFLSNRVFEKLMSLFRIEYFQGRLVVGFKEEGVTNTGSSVEVLHDVEQEGGDIVINSCLRMCSGGDRQAYYRISVPKTVLVCNTQACSLKGVIGSTVLQIKKSDSHWSRRVDGEVQCVTTVGVRSAAFARAAVLREQRGGVLDFLSDGEFSVFVEVEGVRLFEIGNIKELLSGGCSGGCKMCSGCSKGCSNTNTSTNTHSNTTPNTTTPNTSQGFHFGNLKLQLTEITTLKQYTLSLSSITPLQHTPFIHTINTLPITLSIKNSQYQIISIAVPSMHIAVGNTLYLRNTYFLTVKLLREDLLLQLSRPCFLSCGCDRLFAWKECCFVGCLMEVMKGGGGRSRGVGRMGVSVESKGDNSSSVTEIRLTMDGCEGEGEGEGGCVNECVNGCANECKGMGGCEGAYTHPYTHTHTNTYPYTHTHTHPYTPHPYTPYTHASTPGVLFDIPALSFDVSSSSKNFSISVSPLKLCFNSTKTHSLTSKQVSIKIKMYKEIQPEDNLTLKLTTTTTKQFTFTAQQFADTKAAFFQGSSKQHILLSMLTRLKNIILPAAVDARSGSVVTLNSRSAKGGDNSYVLEGDGCVEWMGCYFGRVAGFLRHLDFGGADEFVVRIGSTDGCWLKVFGENGCYYEVKGVRVYGESSGRICMACADNGEGVKCDSAGGAKGAKGGAKGAGAEDKEGGAVDKEGAVEPNTLTLHPTLHPTLHRTSHPHPSPSLQHHPIHHPIHHPTHHPIHHPTHPSHFLFFYSLTLIVHPFSYIHTPTLRLTATSFLSPFNTNTPLPLTIHIGKNSSYISTGIPITLTFNKNTYIAVSKHNHLTAVFNLNYHAKGLVLPVYLKSINYLYSYIRRSGDRYLYVLSDDGVLHRALLKGDIRLWYREGYLMWFNRLFGVMKVFGIERVKFLNRGKIRKSEVEEGEMVGYMKKSREVYEKYLKEECRT